MSRRKFFKLLADSVAKAVGEFAYEVARPDKTFVRPPGSGDEDTFLSLCTNRGQESFRILRSRHGLHPLSRTTTMPNEHLNLWLLTTERFNPLFMANLFL
jgi:hypothetical protein